MHTVFCINMPLSNTVSIYSYQKWETPDICIIFHLQYKGSRIHPSPSKQSIKPYSTVQASASRITHPSRREAQGGWLADNSPLDCLYLLPFSRNTLSLPSAPLAHHRGHRWAAIYLNRFQWLTQPPLPPAADENLISPKWTASNFILSMTWFHNAVDAPFVGFPPDTSYIKDYCALYARPPLASAHPTPALSQPPRGSRWNHWSVIS